MSLNSVYIHTPDFAITRMITDRIGLHSVLLKLLTDLEKELCTLQRNTRPIGGRHYQLTSQVTIDGS